MKKKWFKDGSPVLSLEEKLRLSQEIFAACVVGPNGWQDCWLYPTKNGSGYGMVRVGDRTYAASRIMLAIHTGESFDVKVDACHATDVCPYRNCCNPAHLFWASHTRNCQERNARIKEGMRLFKFWETHAWINGVFFSDRIDPSTFDYPNHAKQVLEGVELAPKSQLNPVVSSCGISI